MKPIIFATILIILSISNLFSETIESKTALTAAQNHIIFKGYNNTHSIIDIQEYSGSDQKLFYLIHLFPQGFIIVAANDNLTPIVAFSFLDNIDNDGKLINILKYDIGLRLENICEMNSDLNKNKWQEILKTNKKDTKGQIWPTPGSTPTGGWLLSNWTQNAPYSDMCPMDPVTSTRSLAGCPAVAMGMILNYHKTTNNTVFDDSDDYYHNYAGRQYTIDDDYLTIDFPSFPELNAYLDTLNYNYQNNIPQTNQDKAALVFACAVACTQVFTSSASGTFGVNQAFDAYQRFSFNNIDILYDGDTSLESRLIQNIIDTLPAHLALVDPGWTTGHNVVVDGYDSNGFFHLNFGWGGSSNGWYTLPDGIPYSLTVIEGLIIDIYPDNSTNTNIVSKANDINIFPNPSNGIINILADDIMQIEIFNALGKIVYFCSNDISRIDLSGFEKGIYFISVSTNNRKETQKLVLF